MSFTVVQVVPQVLQVVVVVVVVAAVAVVAAAAAVVVAAAARRVQQINLGPIHNHPHRVHLLRPN